MLFVIARIVDALAIALALWAGTALHGVDWTENYTIAGVLAVLLFHVSGESVALYRPGHDVSLGRRCWSATLAWIGMVLGLAVLAWMSKTTGYYSRVATGLWLLLALAGVVSWRGLGHLIRQAVRARGHGMRRVAIAGANECGERLAHLVRSSPTLGLKLVGLFDDPHGGAGASERAEPPSPLVGDLDTLVDRARANQLDLICIALPMKDEERIHQLIARLSNSTVSVYVIPDYFAQVLAHARWTSVGPVPALSIFETPFLGAEGWVKRAEDLVLGTLFLMLLALPMALIAAAVKLSSPGPALFRQRRHGLDGEEFGIWKFRTMTVREDGDGVAAARRADARVTPVGAFLRRTSLDELPQLFNVLAGDMSIVGPRPHATAQNDKYRTLIRGYMLRHKVRPGITGWAQVNGWRGDDTLEKMEQRLRCDLWYIRSWSLWLDLRIIARTAVKVLFDRHAY